MKIMLIQLPPWGVETLPIGISYIAGAVSAKHEVDVFDINIRLFNDLPDKRDYWYSQDTVVWRKIHIEHKDLIDRYIREINSKNYDAIGFAANRFSLELLNYILPFFSARKIVGGGICADRQTRNMVSGKADYFVIGEGDSIILKVLDSIESGTQLQDDEITVSKEGDSVCVESNRKARVDEIPFPVYDKFPVELYEDKLTLPLTFSRGCIRKCAFCSDTVQTAPFRIRKPEHVAEEVKRHVLRYNRRIFSVTDLIINGSIPFLDRFCDLLIKEKLRISWAGQGTIREEMTPQFLMKLRFAGCTGISYGVESFSDHVLELMRKGYSADLAKQVIKGTKEAGISVGINLIVGFPGETEEDMDQTIEGLKEIAGYLDQINSMNVCTVNRDAELFTMYEKYGMTSDSYKTGAAWKLSDRSSDIHIRLKRYERLNDACTHLNLVPRWTNTSAVRTSLIA